MKKGLRKWMAALMCGLLMMGHVFSVQAVGHTCVEHEAYKECESYQSNGDIHWVKCRVVYVCQTCKRVMRSKEEKREEAHNRNEFRDLGHQGKHDHRYEIYCGKCNGGRQTVTITTCDVETTGYHTTPW